MKKIKSWTELAWKDTLEKQDSKKIMVSVCMSLYSSGFFLTNLLVDSVCRTHKESTLSCHDQCDNLLWWVIWCWWGQPNHVILITSSRKFHMEKLPLGLVHAVFCGQVSRKGIWASWFPSLLSVHFTFNFFILFEKKL